MSVEVLPKYQPKHSKFPFEPASPAQKAWLESKAELLLGGGSVGSLKTSTAIIDGSLEFDNSDMHTIMFRKTLGCTNEMLSVLVALAETFRPQSDPRLFVHPCCTNSGLGRPQETSHEMPLSSSSHSPRPDHKGNSMFCALRVHKIGSETQSRDPSRERLCARESLVLSPVRDCSGFAMTDHVRCLFAQCQASFCLIGSDSRVPGQPGFPHYTGCSS